MAYDVNKMLSDGYSLKDIGNAMGYDVDKMHKDGYSDDDIVQAFENYNAPTEPASAPEPKATNPLDRMQQISDTNALPGIDNKAISGTDEPSDLLNPPPQPEGTEPISTLVPQNKPDKTGAFNADVSEPLVEGAGQVVAGLRTLPLGMAKTISDAREKLGLPRDKVTDENVEKLSEYITDYNKRHPDQVIHPSTVGELGAFALARGATALKTGAQMGTIEFLQNIGKNKNYSDSVKDAVLTAILSGASVGILNKIFPAEGKLSTEAKILLKLNQNRMSEAEALKALKGIPKKDQAISLAERFDLAKNYFGNAVGQDDILAGKLGKRLEQRKNIIEPFTADEQDVAQAKKTFGEMKSRVDTEVPHMLDTTSLKAQLEPLQKYYATDPSPLGKSIRDIMIDLSGDKVSAGTVLDLRENINALLRKPSVKKVYKTRKTLESIKNQLDTFRANTFPKDLNQQIDNEIAKYSETMNRKLLGDIIDKNTKSDFAVNWDAVLKDAKSQGLRGKVLDQVLPILKEFAVRFHNDKYLSNAITPLGKHDNLNALGVWSKIVMETLNAANRATFGIFAKSRYKSTLITNAIRKSIKKSDTYLDFVEDLVKKKVITPEAATEIKQIAYKPEAKTTGDVNLNPLTATEKGTISGDASAGIMKERSDELIRDFVLKSGKSDEVAQKASKILENNRLNKIIKRARNQLKTEDAEANKRMLQKIVTEEANQLIKAVNKAYGVKLPPKEAEKIIKLKIDELNN